VLVRFCFLQPIKLELKITSEMKSTVLHFLLDHRGGGQCVYAKSLISSFRENSDYTHELFVNSDGRFSTLNLRKYSILFFPFELVINSFILYFIYKSSGYLSKKCIFHVHGAMNLQSLLLARIARGSVVWHLHESYVKFNPLIRLGQLILLGCDSKIISVSKKAKLIYNLPNIDHVPPFIDPVFWKAESLHRLKIEVKKRSLQLLVVANLNPLKGVDILIESLARVDASFTLNIIGAKLDSQSKYCRHLERKAKTLISSSEPYTREVNFLGELPPFTVRNHLANSDILLIPSRTEGSPIVLLEGMASGIEIVAFNVGDISEMSSGYQGITLIAPEDRLSLTKKLSDAVKSTSYSRCEPYIPSAYTFTNVEHKLSNVYQTFLR
jgi:glycosyltransferase involved in cell wall biosynthesis